VIKILTKSCALQVVAPHIVDWNCKLYSLSVDLSVADFVLILPLC